MKTVRLAVMMFVQFLMLPVWLIPLLPYVQGLEGGQDWVFACGLLIGIGTFASPLVGMFADRFLNAEKVLAICNALTAAFLGLAFFVRDPAVLFAVLLATMLVYMPTWSVSSAIVLAHAPAATFARIRAIGSIGWVASGLFSVIGAKVFGNGNFDATPWIFASGAAAALLGAAIALTLPATPPEAKGTPMSVVDALGLKAFALFRDPAFAAFGLLITLAMVPFCWYVAYNPVYLAESGFSYLTLTQNLGQVGEIIFMLTVPFIIRKCGYKWALVLGMGAVMLRYAAFLMAVKFGFAVGDFAGILVHGLAFGILCVGAQMYIDDAAPAELKNQAQGLVMLLTNGIGLFLSNLVFHRILGLNVIAADPVRHDWTVPYVSAFCLAFAIAVAFAVAFNPKQAGKE